MDEVSFGQKLTDEQAMQLAISEAIKGAGFVSPNPQVGCVILDSSNGFLSKGHHRKFGEAHAEVYALQGLTESQLKDARMFVTLEPCAHEGKTPSCAKAIVRLPLKEVVYGLLDPNPLVSGEGARIIANAGISTRLYHGPLTEQLEEACEHFLINQKEKRPFISVKVAVSLDGQMALKTGESKWITGEKAREYAHYLRAIHDAILVGQETFEIDNPSLNIRHPHFPNKKNKVIVLLGMEISHLRPRDMNILKHHNEDDVFFLQKQSDGYRRLTINNEGILSSTNVLPEYDLNLTHRLEKSKLLGSILIEGGAGVLSSFISEKRVDRLYLFQAPILLGAKGGKAWTEHVMISSMGQKISLKNLRVQQLGSDQLITGRFNRGIEI